MNFKEWVESHNPELNWNWDDPDQIRDQLNSVIKECGNLDIDTIFSIFRFDFQNTGLNEEQNDRFIVSGEKCSY